MIGSRLGGFEVVRELGRGGMGVVYEATQTSPRRQVALKVLPPQFAQSPGVATRFKEEANRMAALDGHPNVATVYAAGEENGVAYFAMQLLTGGDLEGRLQREGRLQEREAAEIAARVALALDFAHQRGIVHRDIKPANIMFSSQGEPVVTDFGIAKAADEVRMTLTGMSVCTPEYASPEQIKGNPIDGRSDLYSLGVVLYRMVCGRPLFDCDNPMTWAMKHISEMPQSPGVWCPGLNPELQQIILRCLAKEPSERFSTGADLAKALRGVNWQAPAGVGAGVIGTVAPAFGGAYPPVSTADAPGPTMPVPDGGPAWDPHAAQTKPRRPAKWPYVIGVVGLLTLLVGAFLGYMANRPVKVPDVQKLSGDAALAKLSELGLTGRRDKEEYNESIGKGLVCGQTPAPGTEVEKDSVVSLTISRGTKIAGVPSLLGMSIANATVALKEAGGMTLQQGGVRYSDPYPVQTICAQHPAAGANAERGDAVRVVLSKGPQPPLPKAEIETAIGNWTYQWQNGSADSYVLGCYAPDARIYANSKWYSRQSFYVNELDKIGVPGVSISVSTSPPAISWQDENCTVVRSRFHLEYWRYNMGVLASQSSGSQTLDFARRGGQWLIVKDEFH